MLRIQSKGIVPSEKERQYDTYQALQVEQLEKRVALQREASALAEIEYLNALLAKPSH
jgi:hypothetical protein